MNRLEALRSLGQSIWLDFIQRSMLEGGELARLVERDGVGGVTSNPAIFHKAIEGSQDYAGAIDTLSAEGGRSAKEIYEALAIRDIQDAADVLRPVHRRTAGRDGLVSLEVSPDLAHDTAGTLEEARRLWRAIGRPNAMIKVPATAAGIPAIRALIAEGINVNVTLLFSLSAYEAVAEAFLAGLEARAAAGHDLAGLASVASFFISRIDTAVDAQIEERLASAPAERRELLASLAGKVAIANAKLTYQRYRELFAGPRFAALAARGAAPQRLLWASTSTKNPRYRDVIYVEELIGPDTVNTMPPETLAAFGDHGVARPSLEEDLPGARATMAALERADISMKRVTDDLLADGLRKFSEPFARLLAAVERQAAGRAARSTDPRIERLPRPLADALAAQLTAWDAEDRTRRLWARDAALWTGSDEGRWLGWLDAPERGLAGVDALLRLQEDVRRESPSHVLLLGMGGSSLCPEVLASTFGRSAGFPELVVLDSTDPAQVRGAEERVDLARTIVVVASKSGGTLEPNILMAYFLERVRGAVGAPAAAARFIAVTDPGSSLERQARELGFRAVHHGEPSIGGRFSALSAFGLVPAALAGLDLRRLLAAAQGMAGACAPGRPARDNPGVVLGAALALAAREGRDKLTLVASPGIDALGAWIEQLVAESTGKRGQGIIPVDRERLGPPAAYGADRLLAYLRLDEASEPAQDAALDALERAGQPVLRLHVPTRYDVGAEFFRWELATAVAGSILGLHPFDQPDVEASKVATRALTGEYEAAGRLPEETPLLAAGGIRLFAAPAYERVLAAAAGPARTPAAYLRAHLGHLRRGDYVALLAYVAMTPLHEELLQRTRHRLRDARQVATCLGFGPRFLHSTGQAYKGGPDSGVFLQVTCDDAHDLPVPGQRYTFGVVKAAQARGDLAVLAERGRRCLRVHVGKDVEAGLTALDDLVAQALA